MRAILSSRIDSASSGKLVYKLPGVVFRDAWADQTRVD